MFELLPLLLRLSTHQQRNEPEQGKAGRGGEQLQKATAAFADIRDYAPPAMALLFAFLIKERHAPSPSAAAEG
jgi:hypothetical protein